MSDTKHTPLIVGTPWFCVVADEVMGKDADGEVFVVAQLNPLQEMPDEVAAHHARLIAAAPDYAAAVEHMMAHMDTGGDAWWDGWDMLKAAHAKATGTAS